MSVSIDVLHANILARFDIYTELFETVELQIEEFGIDFGADYTSKKQKIEKLQQDYIGDATHTMTNFYLNASDSTIKEHCYKELTEILERLNVVQTMDNVSKWIIKKLEEPQFKQKSTKKKKEQLLELISKIERYVIEIKHLEKDEEMCKKCSLPFINDEKSNEYICKKCGVVWKMYGETFEEAQIQQDPKHNRYDPTKHCKAWINRLQGRESVEIPEHVISAVKQKIKDDGIYLDILTCEMIRKYLSDLKLSRYNPNVPQIWKRITNKELEEFTDREVNQICMYFSRVVQILNDLPENTKTNCPYQPFFIYKIVEQIMNTPRDIERRNKILSRIHLQTRNTIIENDKLWFQICKHIPTFDVFITRLG